MTPVDLEAALRAVGELLEADGVHVAVVVVGGAALTLQGIVERGTFDIDVIARAEAEGDSMILVEAEPLPTALTDAVTTVARDLTLQADWMNTVVARQWTQGLPPGTAEGITWRTYGGLTVGLVGRGTLIALKLFAAADRGPDSVHVQDLVALDPDADELAEAAAWIRGQDAAPEFPGILEEVLTHVSRSRRTS